MNIKELDKSFTKELEGQINVILTKRCKYCTCYMLLEMNPWTEQEEYICTNQFCLEREVYLGN